MDRRVEYVAPTEGFSVHEGSTCGTPVEANFRTTETLREAGGLNTSSNDAFDEDTFRVTSCEETPRRPSITLCSNRIGILFGSAEGPMSVFTLDELTTIATQDGWATIFIGIPSDEESKSIFSSRISEFSPTAIGLFPDGNEAQLLWTVACKLYNQLERDKRPPRLLGRLSQICAAATFKSKKAAFGAVNGLQDQRIVISAPFSLQCFVLSSFELLNSISSAATNYHLMLEFQRYNFVPLGVSPVEPPSNHKDMGSPISPEPWETPSSTSATVMCFDSMLSDIGNRSKSGSMRWIINAERYFVGAAVNMPTDDLAGMVETLVNQLSTGDPSSLCLFFHIIQGAAEEPHTFENMRWLICHTVIKMLKQVDIADTHRAGLSVAAAVLFRFSWFVDGKVFDLANKLLDVAGSLKSIQYINSAERVIAAFLVMNRHSFNKTEISSWRKVATISLANVPYKSNDMTWIRRRIQLLRSQIQKGG